MSAFDHALVENGRVVSVYRRSLPPRVPPGSRLIAAAPDMVAAGMLYDEASSSFLALPPPSFDVERNRLPPRMPDTVVVHQAGIHGSPVVQAPALVPAAGGSNVTNTITLNINPATGSIVEHRPAHIAAVAPETPQAAPRAIPGAPLAHRGSAPPAAYAPQQPAGPTSYPILDDLQRGVREALRAMQADIWPPEREHIADLAACFLLYRSAASVPDLVALTPPDMTVEQVAEVALQARDACQHQILAIGRMIDERVPLIRSASDAEHVLGLAHVIREGLHE